MRGLRSTPTFRLWLPWPSRMVEKSSRTCQRSCRTAWGVDAFWPTTTEGKRRLMPWLVGSRLLSKRLKWTVSWLTLLDDASQVCIPCSETFLLVASWKALSVGWPPIATLGWLRRPSREVFFWYDTRRLADCDALKRWSSLATIRRSRNGASNEPSNCGNTPCVLTVCVFSSWFGSIAEK